MYLSVVAFCAVVMFLCVIKIARIIRDELEDRSPQASNQSGNALIAILVIGGLGGICLVIFLTATYLRYK